MNFEIIFPSQGHEPWTEDDKVHIGRVEGFLRGWNFEFRNADGKYNYNSLICFEREPDGYVELFGEKAFSAEKANGWEPTGRVMFRGYYTSYFDPDENGPVVEPASLEAVVRKAYPDWKSVPRGCWSDHAVGSLEKKKYVGLYREADGSYTIQGFDGDNVTMCESVALLYTEPSGEQDRIEDLLDLLEYTCADVRLETGAGCVCQLCEHHMKAGCDHGKNDPDCFTLSESVRAKYTGEMGDSVVTECYGTRKTWETRQDALDFFEDCIKHSEGAERDRYFSIWSKLKNGDQFADDAA